MQKKEGVAQRQSYRRVSKQLVRDSYNGKHPRRRKKAKKAQKKLNTIAGRLVRELERELREETLEKYLGELGLFKKVLSQKRGDSNKIYSLHKPHTACIAKGKAHKKYEFGNKVGIMATMGERIVVTAVEAFEGNPNDGNTIKPLLEQGERLLGHRPGEVVYDRGGRGRAQIGTTTVSTPKPPLKGDTDYRRRKKRKKSGRRAAIEPVIGHLKKHFRMQQNYLGGKKSPKINALLAATGWNMKKMMEGLAGEFLFALIKTLCPAVPFNYRTIRANW